MKENTYSSEEKKIRSVAGAAPSKKASTDKAVITDNRPESVFQRKINAAANTGSSRKELSPPLKNPVQNVDTNTAPIQRKINTLLPVKSYRREGGSNSSITNKKIKDYNQELDAEDKDPGDLNNRLNEIDTSLDSVNKSKKKESDQIRREIGAERRILKAGDISKGERIVEDVMEHNTAKSELQREDPLLALDDEDTPNDEARDFILSREVSHATNPLKLTGSGKSIGDVLSANNELRNIHETGQSLVGNNKDGDKRLNTEMGMFYPQKVRRGSFSRSAHENATATKGIKPEEKPPLHVLPKYGAVNLTNSPYGALHQGDETGLDMDVPLHFVMDDKVLKERTTFTSHDTLKGWNVGSRYDSYRKNGLISSVSKDAVPTDDKAWEMGAMSTYEGNNFGKVLKLAEKKASAYKDPAKKNPEDYIEAQMHGEILIDRDVKYVRANFAKLFGNPRFESLYDAFEGQKKKVIWYYGQNNKRQANQFEDDWSNPQRTAQMKKAWKKATSYWLATWKLIEKSSRPELLSGYQENGSMDKANSAKLIALWNELSGGQSTPKTGDDITESVVGSEESDES